jgi:tetratricopeptide (TPR) repeat protein
MIKPLRKFARLGLPLALAFSLVAPAAAQSDDCLADVDYASRAEASLQEGQYASAVDAYGCVLANDPNNLDALLGRASATLYQAAVRGDVNFNVTPDLNVVYDESYETLTQAIADASQALVDDPENVEALALRGYLYWYLGQNQNAVADFDTILREDDGNAYAYLFRGAANLYLGNQAKAQTDFDNAVGTSAEPAGAYAQIGAMYGNTGYADLAMQNYDMAIELDPTNATFYSYRAYTHDQLGNIDAAVEDYTSAIELDPNNENYYLSRAWEYEQLSDYENAVADYTSAIQLNSNNAESYQFRGWAYISLADFEAAAADFEAALALDSTNRWVYLGQGTALAALGQPVDSALAFAQYVTLMQSFQSDGETMKLGNSQSLELTEGQVYAIPLNAEAGTTLEIQATSPIGEVDPMMVLLGTDNRPLAGSDDIEDGNLNSAITIEIPTSGRYTLVVTHAGGGSYGFVDVTVTDADSSTAPQPTEVANAPTCTADDALSLMEAGDYAAAVDAYICAVAANPDDVELLLDRGLAGLMIDLNEDTLAAIDDADSLEPGIIAARVDALTEQLDANPDDVAALTARAYLYWYGAMDDLAVADFGALLQLDPNNAFAVLYRGSSYQYMGNTKAATVDFERALETYNDNISALEVILYSYRDTGDDANALVYLDQALALQPDNTPLRVVRARTLSRLGDYEAAIDDINIAIEAAPDVAIYYEDLGWFLLRAGRSDEALAAFDEGLAMDPGLTYALIGRGSIHSEMGNTAEAAQDYADYISVIELDSSEVTLNNDAAFLTMSEGMVYRLTVQLAAGQTIEVAADSEDDAVDTLLLVTDANGTPLLGNDDTDITAGNYNASLSFTAPQAGEYVIAVTHSSAGNTGDMDLFVTGLAASIPTPTPGK